jgi:hypothetical protein
VRGANDVVRPRPRRTGLRSCGRCAGRVPSGGVYRLHRVTATRYPTWTLIMPTHVELFRASTFSPERISPERFSAERPPSPVTAPQPALVLHEQVHSKLAGGPATLLLELAVAMVTVVGDTARRWVVRTHCSLGTVDSWPAGRRAPSVASNYDYAQPTRCQVSAIGGNR